MAEKTPEITPYNEGTVSPPSSPLNASDIRNIVISELANLRSKIKIYRGRQTIIGQQNDVNAIYIDDDNSANFPTVHAQRSVGPGSVFYGQTDSASGHCFHGYGQSNTPVSFAEANSQAAGHQYAVPFWAKQDIADNTNFFRQIILDSLTSNPQIAIWLAKNANPHTVLYGFRGDFCYSTDGNIYINQDVAGGTNWQKMGIGDVVGPGSAVDGDLAVFDGTTGKLIKDGGAGSFSQQEYHLQVFLPNDSLTTGDGKYYLDIRDMANGMDLVAVYARVITAGS